MNTGAVTVRSLIVKGETHLVVRCDKCPRRGRYALPRLLPERGDVPLPALLAELARGCFHRGPGVFARCGARFEGL